MEPRVFIVRRTRHWVHHLETKEVKTTRLGFQTQERQMLNTPVTSFGKLVISVLVLIWHHLYESFEIYIATAIEMCISFVVFLFVCFFLFVFVLFVFCLVSSKPSNVGETLKRFEQSQNEIGKMELCWQLLRREVTLHTSTPFISDGGKLNFFFAIQFQHGEFLRRANFRRSESFLEADVSQNRQVSGNSTQPVIGNLEKTENFSVVGSFDWNHRNFVDLVFDSRWGGGVLFFSSNLLR